MYRSHKILTVAELQAEIDAWTSDEEDNYANHEVDKVSIIIIPPDKVDDISDNEDIDENVQVINNEMDLPKEMPGQFEIEYICEADNVNLPVASKTKNELKDIDIDRCDVKPSTSKSRRRIPVENKPKWSKSKKFNFEKQPIDNEKKLQKTLYEKIGFYTPLQLWECFFDDEVMNMIVDSTNEYAGQKNVPGFITTVGEIRTFLGILYLTGYNTLPTTRSYWSNQSTLGCQFVKNAMSRDRFEKIKQNLHVCDNKNLDASDKFAKVTPLNNVLNKKFMQFGVFDHNLSIDEQMIAYYGRHSLKMFIRGKPIRFGYKYWVLASATGYCYFFIPYAGASANNDANYGLGENVVLRLLENISDPSQHNVTFDNFFTSHKLLCTLSQKGYFATGTVRDNRTNNALLEDHKLMKKKPRGSSDFCFDKSNNLIAVRWNDNSVVTVMSNFLGLEPMCRAKRFDRKNRKMANIEQPYLVHAYNQRMGGVDLFDNAMNKKWYWPLLTNAMDAAMVNAWKLHCMCRRCEGATIMSQLDFRLSVVESLVTIPESRCVASGKSFTNAQQIARRTDKFNHTINKIGKRSRCGQCGGKTEFGCSKCNVNLHPKDCFAQFHDGIPKNIKKIKKSQ